MFFKSLRLDNLRHNTKLVDQNSFDFWIKFLLERLKINNNDLWKIELFFQFVADVFSPKISLSSCIFIVFSIVYNADWGIFQSNLKVNWSFLQTSDELFDSVLFCCVRTEKNPILKFGWTVKRLTDVKLTIFNTLCLFHRYINWIQLKSSHDSWLLDLDHAEVIFIILFFLLFVSSLNLVNQFLGLNETSFWR